MRVFAALLRTGASNNLCPALLWIILKYKSKLIMRDIKEYNKKYYMKNRERLLAIAKVSRIIKARIEYVNSLYQESQSTLLQQPFPQQSFIKTSVR